MCSDFALELPVDERTNSPPNGAGEFTPRAGELTPRAGEFTPRAGAFTPGWTRARVLGF